MLSMLSKLYPSLLSLRPHLQRESAQAEESSPANLARSRCAGGGDELFGRFVGFWGYLKRKAPLQNEFKIRYGKKYPQLVGLALLGASILHSRNFARGSYYRGRWGVKILAFMQKG